MQRYSTWGRRLGYRLYIHFCLAYFVYNKGLPLSMRHSGLPNLKERGKTGDVIYVLTVLVTLFSRYNFGLYRRYMCWQRHTAMCFGLENNILTSYNQYCFDLRAHDGFVLRGMDGSKFLAT
ncbi:hypothetical protein OH492_10880 [Vibrio chagasii]|nr:hypothetical protein [Vibrio chagasii]